MEMEASPSPIPQHGIIESKARSIKPTKLAPSRGYGSYHDLWILFYLIFFAKDFSHLFIAYDLDHDFSIWLLNLHCICNVSRFFST